MAHVTCYVLTHKTAYTYIHIHLSTSCVHGAVAQSRDIPATACCIVKFTGNIYARAGYRVNNEVICACVCVGTAYTCTITISHMTIDGTLHRFQKVLFDNFCIR